MLRLPAGRCILKHFTIDNGTTDQPGRASTHAGLTVFRLLQCSSLQQIPCPIAACDPGGRGTVEASAVLFDGSTRPASVRRRFSRCFHQWNRFLVQYMLSATNE